MTSKLKQALQADAERRAETYCGQSGFAKDLHQSGVRVYTAGAASRDELIVMLADQLNRIAAVSDENGNFSRSEQECEFYIGVAKVALTKLRNEIGGIG
jgi:hypothetical protein